MDSTQFDVVIVGGGIAGSLLAKKLTWAGKRVLLLEAGRNIAATFEGYNTYLQNFYSQWLKTDQSPFPDNPNARQPEGLPDLHGKPGKFDDYMKLADGSLGFPGNYVRDIGGTSLHWLGTSLRMLPADLKMAANYQQGVDWPISYQDLNPYYNIAEWEIGVAADVPDQSYLNVAFDAGYYYPMQRIPPTYMDQQFAAGLEGMKVRYGSGEYPVKVSSLPQARNSTPNPGYQPAGAVGRPFNGQRCEGFANCVPLCPVQAKYNSLKTLTASKAENLVVQTQSVAYQLDIDPASARITGVRYKQYFNDQSPDHTEGVARGTIYIVAAHVVESAKLLLASNAANTSGMVGRNLMSHPTLIAWGLFPEGVGCFRGPAVTSGIESLRDGEFRKDRAAFRADLGNWGWSYPTGAPYSDLDTFVDTDNLFGEELRARVASTISRQVSLQFLVEQLPDPNNRITIDPAFRDQLGNFRPILQYDIGDYTRRGFVAARALSKQIFQRLGIEDFSAYSAAGNPGFFTFENEGYGYWAAGHFAGTTRMGTHRNTSVVNPRQQTWDHANLYVVGNGSFCTLGTPNPTLTMAALTLMTADQILQDLGR